MNNIIRCNLGELLLCLSKAQDLISPVLASHQQQVAYLSYRLAEQLDLSVQERKEIFLAALVHDIGALSTNELLSITEHEPITAYNHAFKGASLVQEFKPLRSIYRLVKYHHVPWSYGEGLRFNGETVPLYSHIIHLADRVCTGIQNPKQNVLSQLPKVLEGVQQRSGALYMPNFVAALNKLSKKQYIWLDLISRDPVEMLPTQELFDSLLLDIDDIIDFAILFSHIIDFRSRFTACHSAGVAKVAEYLANLTGFSPIERKMMLIAGYLHDLGKLAIDNEILEKPDNLQLDEFNEIRTHTYYTYVLLNKIQQFDTIKIWAAYHHERLDGKGYPFHIVGENLPLGSRIMAVADVFTAITEDRPYRKGMSMEHATKVLNNMVDNGALDGNIVKTATDNFALINDIRAAAQKVAARQYRNFLGIMPDKKTDQELLTL
ncbi:HD-GYP domain-containing protein [Oscillospiraceae bacterium LTW-04]|nr:HD domain-containing protein [Oscillospiraceae bacterium MB24-C1]